jgi:hypothetical protein
LLLKKYDQIGEIKESDFEYYDEKKINQVINEEKAKKERQQAVH